MSEWRSSDRNDQSLAPLVDLSPLLKFDYRGRPRATERFDVPSDEYGIPSRVRLMRKVLGSISTRHIWTGDYDMHHVAWTGETYRSIIDNDELIGAAYRGCASLKIRMPRQLHNYIHEITNPPEPPDVETMRQYALEHNQVKRLYDTIKTTSYVHFPDLEMLPEDEKDVLREASFRRKLEDMEEGQLGVMPEIGMLYDLELVQARQLLRAIDRVQGFSNSRRVQSDFLKQVA